MGPLPRELYLEIFSYLLQRHLRSVSMTCRLFARLVEPSLFSTLVLDGNAQDDCFYIENGAMNVRYPGRKRTVELANLDTAINDLFDLDIARYVKTLKFSPKIYVKGFWKKYLDFLEAGAEEWTWYDITDVADGDEDDDGDDFRQLREQRQSMPGKEREIVAKAEAFWDDKVIEQESKAGLIHAALARLFRSMPNLERIEITDWVCKLREHHIIDYPEEQVGDQFARAETAWSHLQLISDALQTSGTRIRDLVISTVNTQLIKTSPALLKLFSCLTTLKFDLEDISFMRRDGNTSITPFTVLIQSARDTLRSIKCWHDSSSSMRFPYNGEHSLERLFGAKSPGSEMEFELSEFPNLREFSLRNMILYTPSLIAFFNRQPVLQVVTLDFILLATRELKWSDVAASLASTCNSLSISYCGQELYPLVPPDAIPTYSNIQAYLPYAESSLPPCGWRVSRTFFEDLVDRKAKLREKRVEDRVVQEWEAQGMSKGEWVVQEKRRWRDVEYERI
ncbi:Nn.00g027760.m01.CDS01 [Neocucurbitaria sp. VM-36]